MELRCSHELALLLGAIEPHSIDHHKELKHAGFMLVRDDAGAALFWPVIKELRAALLRQTK